MYMGSQRFRLRHCTTFRTYLFGSESFSQGIRGNNTLPGSTSVHSGVAKAPVYLVISSETRRGRAPSPIRARGSRISRSSRTLVPCKETEFNPKHQAMVVHDEPESTWSKNDPEHISSLWNQYTIHSTAGRALDWRNHIRRHREHRT